jgi:Zn-dependent protease with chaperone function
VNSLASLQMLILAGLGFALIAGCAASFLVRPALEWTADWDPARRHRALLLLAAAPWLWALSAVLSVMLPSLLGVYWPARDHCEVHGGHSHLCFVHPAHGYGGSLGWTAIAAAIGWALWRLMRRVHALGRAASVVHQLSAEADYDARHGVWIVPSTAAFCVAAGLCRPRLLASQGLVATASEEQLSVVLHHERAHVRRRDNLLRLFVTAASVLLLPRARAALLAGLALAAERACDETAALLAGDRLRVAETLLALEARLHADVHFGPGLSVASFGASSLPQRVEAMLAPAPTRGSCTALGTLTAVAALCVLAVHDGLHHATESLLHRLAG